MKVLHEATRAFEADIAQAFEKFYAATGLFPSKCDVLLLELRRPDGTRSYRYDRVEIDVAP